MDDLCNLCGKPHDSCGCFCDICGKPDCDGCLCEVCGEPDCNESCCCHTCGPDGCDCGDQDEGEDEGFIDEEDKEAFEHAMDRND